MKDIFCTKDGKVTEQAGSISGSDLLFTCACGHFVKFPQVETKKELQEMIDEHEAINRPLVEEKAKAEEQAKILEELLK